MIQITKDDYDILQAIKTILARKNSAEVRKERENIVVVEIRRKVNIKRPME